MEFSLKLFSVVQDQARPLAYPLPMTLVPYR